MDNHYIIAAVLYNQVQLFRDIKTQFGLLEDETEMNHGELFLRNLPHITLKYPFDFKGCEEDLVRQLETVKFSPFDVTVDEVEVFTTKKHGNIVVILPEKHPQLMKLHDDIYESISGLFEDTEGLYFEKEKFNPHISVLYKVTDEKLEEATQTVTHTLIPNTCTIKQFGLYRSLPDNLSKRVVVKEFHIES